MNETAVLQKFDKLMVGGVPKAFLFAKQNIQQVVPGLTTLKATQLLSFAEKHPDAYHSLIFQVIPRFATYADKIFGAAFALWFFEKSKN